MTVAAILSAVVFGLVAEPLATHRSRADEMERSLGYLPVRMRRLAILASGCSQVLLAVLSVAVVLDLVGAATAMGIAATITAIAYLAHVRRVIVRGEFVSCGCSTIGGAAGKWSYLPGTLLLVMGVALPASGSLDVGSAPTAAYVGLLLIAASIGLTSHTLAGTISLRSQAWTPF